MSKSTYEISVVEPDKVSLWREKWESNTPMSKRVRDADKHGALGQTRIVEANNLAEAIRIVKQQNPGLVVMEGGSSKIG